MLAGSGGTAAEVTSTLKNLLMGVNNQVLRLTGGSVPHRGAVVFQWPGGGADTAAQQAPATTPAALNKGLGVVGTVGVVAGAALGFGFVSGAVALGYRKREQRRIQMLNAGMDPKLLAAMDRVGSEKTPSIPSMHCAIHCAFARHQIYHFVPTACQSAARANLVEDGAGRSGAIRC